jgi:HTH-type transcriptional regulator/antitoxin HigA
MTDRWAAEVFPPGIFIKEELEARGWTQEDLADILGRDSRLVSEIITAKRSITPDTAKELGEAFGTGGQYWMNLQAAYQLWQRKPRNGEIARRAKIYAKAPIKLMIRRNWIEASENVDILERRILDFYGINNLDEEPSIPAAARTGTKYYKQLSLEQRAWLFRARHLAGAVSAQKFTDSRLHNGLKQLRALSEYPEETRRIPRILAEAGVRFLIIEHLPGTKIDGVCFWMNETSPVVVLSFRYNRIDWFWHTLMHEMKHVANRDGLRQPIILDSDLMSPKNGSGDERPEREKMADKYASDFLVPTAELDDFIVRHRPLYSTDKIIRFAARLKVHAGIVVGQLQFRREIPYAHSRELLVPIRDIVTATALTDGWGHIPPADL